MQGKSIKGLEKQMIVAISHPIRVAALTILRDRVSSPAQIARETGESLSDVSYHVKVLREFNLVEFIEERPVRGAMEHFYRAVTRPMWNTEQWARVPIEDREATSEFGMQQVIADVGIAMRAGRFDSRIERQLTRVPVHLDEEGWQKLSRTYDDLLQTIFDIQMESDERRHRSGEEGFSACAVGLAFPTGSAAPSP